MDHLVIRDLEYVAGTKNKPEVSVFVQTDTRRKPLDDNKINVNDIVWMKWSGGPVVAKSKVASLHSGCVRESDISELRELTLGTNLFGLDDYWSELIEKVNFYFMVVRLKEEEWLEEIFFPNARSYGSSWIYLDNEDKYKNWILRSKPEKEVEKQSNRRLPAGLRFDVLRRDNFTCQYCGRKAPNVKLHVDHIKPYKIVKEHKKNNLLTSCQDCNLGKSDKLI